MPLSIGGLLLWWRADALESGGLLNGSSVNVWPDNSGNGFDLVQAVQARQPTLLTGALNGRPVVRFDDDSGGGPTCDPTYLDDCNSAADGFDNASAVNALRGQSAFTLFLVARSNRPNERGYTFGMYASNFDAVMRIGYVAPVNILDRVRVSSQPSQNLNHEMDTLAYAVFTTVCTAGAAGSAIARLWVNGGAPEIDTLWSNAVTFADITYSAVAQDYDAAGATSQRMHGDIAELVLYGALLVDTDRVAIQDYLGAKYAISVGP